MKKIILIITLFYIQNIFSQECLNIDFKLPSYFYAGSIIIDPTALKGFYKDENIPKKTNSIINNIAVEKKFQIIFGEI